MVRKLVIVLMVGFFAISLTGCATMRKNKDLDAENQSLKNQVTVLESQLQSKDEEINSLRDDLVKAEQKKTISRKIIKKKFIGEVKSRPNVKQIQIALTNAGYNPGNSDGKMGKQTAEAIKAFQAANNLTADGKVGKKTWNLLKEYLYKQQK